MSENAKNTPAEEQNPRFANLSPADRFVQEAFERECPVGVGDYFTATLASAQKGSEQGPGAPSIDPGKFRAARAEPAPEASPSKPAGPR